MKPFRNHALVGLENNALRPRSLPGTHPFWEERGEPEPPPIKRWWQWLNLLSVKPIGCIELVEGDCHERKQNWERAI